MIVNELQSVVIPRLASLLRIRDHASLVTSAANGAPGSNGNDSVENGHETGP
jgi:hypothetical protein